MRDVEGRDAVWSHPDLVPTSADLDDPLGFVAGEARADGAETAAFDAALEELLKGGGTEVESTEDENAEGENTKDENTEGDEDRNS